MPSSARHKVQTDGRRVAQAPKAALRANRPEKHHHINMEMGVTGLTGEDKKIAHPS